MLGYVKIFEVKYARVKPVLTNNPSKNRCIGIKTKKLNKTRKVILFYFLYFYYLFIYLQMQCLYIIITFIEWKVFRYRINQFTCTMIFKIKEY